MSTEVIPFAPVTAASSPQLVQFPAVPGNRYVAELHVQPPPGNYASIHVIDWASKIVLKSLFPPPQSGLAESWSITSGDAGGDGLDPTQFGVQFDHSGDRWNAYAIVR